MIVDLAFRLQSTTALPADHGYELFGVLSRLLPEVHDCADIVIHPIAGRLVGDRRMMLTQASRLCLRVPDHRIALLLGLSGKSLRVGEATLRIGVPEVRALKPETAVRSRLVLIKVAGCEAGALNAEIFAAAARRQLYESGVSITANLRPGKRRTVRVRQLQLVGYEVIVEGLSAEESITLQERGLGGKHHMGCGVFVPVDRGVAS